MEKKQVDFVLSVLNQISADTRINENVIVAMVCLMVGNVMMVGIDEILDGSHVLSEKFGNVLISRIPDENKTVCQAVEVLLAYKVNDRIFEILSKEILENVVWKEMQREAVDYLVDGILCGQLNPEIQTPRWLNRLAVALLDPVDGNFYDGSAGVCSTAVEVYRHSLKNQGNISIYTQELNEFFWAVSVVRTFLEGMPDVSHSCGDVIAAPAYHEKDKLQTFDYSIMFPPLGMTKQVDGQMLGQDVFQRFLYPESVRIGWDWAFALHQVASLNEHGKGVLCMFGGAFFNVQSKQIRTEIINSGVVECVIAIPANSLPFTAVPVNLIVFNRNLKKGSKILMIDAQTFMETNMGASTKKRYVLNEEGIREIVAVYADRAQEAQVSRLVSIDELVEADLMPARYVKKNTVDTKEFGTISIASDLDRILKGPNWKTLKEVVQVRTGFNHSKAAVQAEDGDIKIIRLSDVQNGALNLGSIPSYRLARDVDTDKYRVFEGDILLSCKGQAVKTCMVPHIQEYIAASANFMILQADSKLIYPLYLQYYLESPMGMYLIKSRQAGSSIVMLNKKEVNDIPIPYIPLQEQIALADELRSKEKYVQEQIDGLNRMLRDSRLEFYQKAGFMDTMAIGEEEQQ